MKNFIVNVSASTSKVYLEETSVAVDGENIAGKVIFKFNDEEFIDGMARLEWQNGTDKYFQLMEKIGKTYQLPIKNVMTKEGRMWFQLVITQEQIGDDIPVFKSNSFYVFVEKSINAEGEAPSGYDTWLDYANAKLMEMDNLNITASKSGNKETITLTDKQGESHETYIYDGENGVDGKDAKINGVNTLDIVAGENIIIDQEGSTLTITSEAGGDAKVKDVTVNGVSVVEDRIAKVIVPTKVSDLSNDSGFITNTVNNLTNYYLKNNTYTKDEVNTLIGNIEKLTVEIVQELPEIGEPNVLYLVPKTGSTNDVYEEYMYINNNWELIGTTEIDLSNYYTKSEVNTLLGAKQDSLVSGTNIKSINSNSILGNGNLDVPSIYDAKRTELFIPNVGSSTNTTIDDTELVEYNDACLRANQFLPICIKSNEASTYPTLVYIFPQVRYNGKLRYMGYAHKNSGYFYLTETAEISSPVLGNLTKNDLKFTTYTKLFLSTENTQQYTPTNNYHPATKKYVDDKAATKQDTLVSGTNIKTINNESILGTGNLEITGQTIQVATMPTASASEVGNIYQYIGSTNVNYTNGYFYKCNVTTNITHIHTQKGTYIPLDFSVNNHKFELKFQATSMSSDWMYLMGSSQLADSSAIIFNKYNGGLRFGFDGNQYDYNIPNIVDGQIHTALYNGDDGNYGLDNTVLGQYTTYEQNDVWLFRGIFEGEEMEGNLYYVKVWDKTTGDLVHHLVPALGANDRPALYDEVTETYYYDTQDTITYVAGGTTYSWDRVNVQPALENVRICPTKWLTDGTKITDTQTLDDLQWIVDYYLENGTYPNYWIEQYHITSMWLYSESPEWNYKYYAIDFDGVSGERQIKHGRIYVYTPYDSTTIYDDTSADFYPRFDYMSYPNEFAYDYQLNDFLSKGNQDTYIPTGDYNPATKKYVDDVENKVLVQYSQMPTPTEADHIVQYKGTTGNGYKNGCIYKSKSTGTLVPMLTVNSDSQFLLNYEYQYTDKLEIKFRPTMEWPSNSGVLGNVEWSSSGMEIHFDGNTMYIGDGINEHGYSGDYLQNKKYVVTLNNDNDIVINGETKDTYVAFGTYGTLELFSYQGNQGFRGDFYYLRIWDTTTGTLKKEWIPALDGNNTVCIQETVGNTYIYNENYEDTPNTYSQVAEDFEWKLFVDYQEPTVVTNSDSTYTIDNLTEHYLYNLGEITSLTISAVDNIYLETNIFLESGSTATTVSLPDNIVNIGDAPTMASSGGVNSGTLDTNKGYIIKVLNGIAEWKKY